MLNGHVDHRLGDVPLKTLRGDLPPGSHPLHPQKLNNFLRRCIRDAQTANIPFSTALTGALRRCSSLVWLATLHSERLALHPASTAKNGTLTISASLSSNRVRCLGRFDEHKFGRFNTMTNPPHGGLNMLHIYLRLQIAEGKKHGQPQQRRRAPLQQGSDALAALQLLWEEFAKGRCLVHCERDI